MSSIVPRRVLLGALVLGGVVVAALLVSPSASLTAVEAVADDPYLFGLVIVGLYLVRPLFAWPTTPLAVVVGYGYGVTVGVPLALLGVIGTVIPVFLTARWVITAELAATRGSGPVNRFVTRTSETLTRYYETAGPVRGVTASRLAPIPSDVSTCAAAASGVTLRHLILGTAIGELPWTVAGVLVGSSAATLTTDGLGELGWTLAVVCGFVAALLFAGPTYRAARTRSTESREAYHESVSGEVDR